ncbi:MAG: hypothetical protein ACK5TO_08395, partial [Planctomycetaceae bacterium]
MRCVVAWQLALLASLWGPVVGAADAPARPEITGLKFFPEKLELNGIRDTRRVLVSGQTASGEIIDLTAEAQWQVEGTAIELQPDGYVAPRQPGEARLLISAGGRQGALPVTVKDAQPSPVSFIREVQPALSKVGCNQGTCHGAQDGKAGFKLSLRGYDAEFDYLALVDDLVGRRFNRSVPSQSLMLLKPTQGVPHVGGFLFSEDSRYYRLLEQWIAEGCQFDTATRVSRLEVFPQNPVIDREGRKLHQTVIAHFPDGTTRDVTRDSVFSSSNFNVATVTNTSTNSGLVETLRRGETAILVRYEGAYAVNQITVQGDRTGFVWQP